jgi:superfamily II DNA or RNA helicase
MLPHLREYQQGSIDGLRVGVAEGHKRQVLVAPTGAGKSVIAHAIVARSQERKRKVLFAVNRKQLVTQFSERLTKAGIDHGILRGEESRREYLPVIVGSIQTIARRGLPDSFDLIVIDEGHGVPGSKDYMKVIRDNPNATILGLTATPWARGMGRYDPDLGGPIFSNMVVAAHYSQLIADGHLVECDCYAPSEPDLTGVRTQKNQFGETDYVESELAAAVNKPKLVGDIVEHWKRLAINTPTVIFATSIAHSQAIVAAFVEAGFAAEHIDAYCDDDERKAILKRVDDGKTMLISCAALLAEGWDQPSIRTMILARPTKSLIRYIQMAGRILRPYPGKERALLLDHSGTVLRLGFPTEDREYQLDDGKSRENKDEKPVEEKPPTKCPQCGFVDPFRKNPCEVCGFKRTTVGNTAVAAGSLQKLEKPKVATMMDKQKFYSELLHIQRDRGYNTGWIARQYRNKFGVWPKGMQDYPLEPSPETRSYIKSQMIRYAKGKEKAAQEVLA